MNIEYEYRVCSEYHGELDYILCNPGMKLIDYLSEDTSYATINGVKVRVRDLDLTFDEAINKFDIECDCPEVVLVDDRVLHFIPTNMVIKEMA